MQEQQSCAGSSSQAEQYRPFHRSYYLNRLLLYSEFCLIPPYTRKVAYCGRCLDKDNPGKHGSSTCNCAVSQESIPGQEMPEYRWSRGLNIHLDAAKVISSYLNQNKEIKPADQVALAVLISRAGQNARKPVSMLTKVRDQDLKELMFGGYLPDVYTDLMQLVKDSQLLQKVQEAGKQFKGGDLSCFTVLVSCALIEQLYGEHKCNQVGTITLFVLMKVWENLLTYGFLEETNRSQAPYLELLYGIMLSFCYMGADDFEFIYSLVNDSGWKLGELVAKTLKYIKTQWDKWNQKNKHGSGSPGSNDSTVDLDTSSDDDLVDEDKVCKSLMLACLELVTAFYNLRHEEGWDLSLDKMILTYSPAPCKFVTDFENEQGMAPLIYLLKEYDLHLFDLPSTFHDFALLDLLTIASVALTRRNDKTCQAPVEFIRSICDYLAGFIKYTNGSIYEIDNYSYSNSVAAFIVLLALVAQSLDAFDEGWNSICSALRGQDTLKVLFTQIQHCLVAVLGDMADQRKVNSVPLARQYGQRGHWPDTLPPTTMQGAKGGQGGLSQGVIALAAVTTLPHLLEKVSVRNIRLASVDGRHTPQSDYNSILQQYLNTMLLTAEVCQIILEEAPMSKLWLWTSVASLGSIYCLLNISLSTVKARFAQARKQIGEEMGEQHWYSKQQFCQSVQEEQKSLPQCFQLDIYSQYSYETDQALPLFEWPTLQRLVVLVQNMICPDDCLAYRVDKRLFCVCAGIFQTFSKNEHLQDLLLDLNLYNIYFWDPSTGFPGKQDAPSVDYYEVCYAPARIAYVDSQTHWFWNSVATLGTRLNSVLCDRYASAGSVLCSKQQFDKISREIALNMEFRQNLQRLQWLQDLQQQQQQQQQNLGSSVRHTTLPPELELYCEDAVQYVDRSRHRDQFTDVPDILAKQDIIAKHTEQAEGAVGQVVGRLNNLGAGARGQWTGPGRLHTMPARDGRDAENMKQMQEELMKKQAQADANMEALLKELEEEEEQVRAKEEAKKKKKGKAKQKKQKQAAKEQPKSKKEDSMDKATSGLDGKNSGKFQERYSSDGSQQQFEATEDSQTVVQTKVNKQTLEQLELRAWLYNVQQQQNSLADNGSASNKLQFSSSTGKQPATNKGSSWQQSGVAGGSLQQTGADSSASRHAGKGKGTRAAVSSGSGSKAGGSQSGRFVVAENDGEHNSKGVSSNAVVKSSGKGVASALGSVDSSSATYAGKQHTATVSTSKSDTVETATEAQNRKQPDSVHSKQAGQSASGTADGGSGSRVSNASNKASVAHVSVSERGKGKQQRDSSTTKSVAGKSDTQTGNDQYYITTGSVSRTNKLSGQSSSARQAESTSAKVSPSASAHGKRHETSASSKAAVVQQVSTKGVNYGHGGANSSSGSGSAGVAAAPQSSAPGHARHQHAKASPKKPQAPVPAPVSTTQYSTQRTSAPVPPAPPNQQRSPRQSTNVQPRANRTGGSSGSRETVQLVNKPQGVPQRVGNAGASNAAGDAAVKGGARRSAEVGQKYAVGNGTSATVTSGQSVGPQASYGVNGASKGKGMAQSQQQQSQANQGQRSQGGQGVRGAGVTVSTVSTAPESYATSNATISRPNSGHTPPNRSITADSSGCNSSQNRVAQTSSSPRYAAWQKSQQQPQQQAAGSQQAQHGQQRVSSAATPPPRGQGARRPNAPNLAGGSGQAQQSGAVQSTTAPSIVPQSSQQSTVVEQASVNISKQAGELETPRDTSQANDMHQHQQQAMQAQAAVQAAVKGLGPQQKNAARPTQSLQQVQQGNTAVQVANMRSGTSMQPGGIAGTSADAVRTSGMSTQQLQQAMGKLSLATPTAAGGNSGVNKAGMTPGGDPLNTANTSNSTMVPNQAGMGRTIMNRQAQQQTHKHANQPQINTAQSDQQQQTPMNAAPNFVPVQNVIPPQFVQQFRVPNQPAPAQHGTPQMPDPRLWQEYVAQYTRQIQQQSQLDMRMQQQQQNSSSVGRPFNIQMLQQQLSAMNRGANTNIPNNLSAQQANLLLRQAAKGGPGGAPVGAAPPHPYSSLAGDLAGVAELPPHLRGQQVVPGPLVGQPGKPAMVNGAIRGMAHVPKPPDANLRRDMVGQSSDTNIVRDMVTQGTEQQGIVRNAMSQGITPDNRPHNNSTHGRMQQQDPRYYHAAPSDAPQANGGDAYGARGAAGAGGQGRRPSRSDVQQSKLREACERAWGTEISESGSGQQSGGGNAFWSADMSVQNLNGIFGQGGGGASSVPADGAAGERKDKGKMSNRFDVSTSQLNPAAPWFQTQSTLSNSNPAQPKAPPVQTSGSFI